MIRFFPIVFLGFIVIVSGFNGINRMFRPLKVSSLKQTSLQKTTRFGMQMVSEGSVATKDLDVDKKNQVVEGEEFKFESNVARVMDIIINSLYSNKDVFVRELISNAADACDKKRFLALTQQDDSSGGSNNGGSVEDSIGIRVYADREAMTLTIEDRGIGMTKEDLQKNLGRIAESGTKRFLEGLDNKNKADVSLIGQFGVGFYSGFLVANKMTVITKASGHEQLRWDASINTLDTYTIASDASNPNQIETTGTRIILHLKDENDQYVDEVALRALIDRYSEFIAFPIELETLTTVPESIPDLTKAADVNGTVPLKTIMTKKKDWVVVNTKKPLWLRSPKDCTKEEYSEFYKQTFNAFEEPAAEAHFSVEGNVDFKALLYLPSELPYELTRDMFTSSARSLRLYVKRVFINDKFEDMIPRWLLFIRGVVDSNDLPLNVGREILQQSRALRIIKQRLVKKSIEMMANLAKSDDIAYNKFWKNFGKYIKVGIVEDEKNRLDLIPLCRFYSSHYSPGSNSSSNSNSDDGNSGMCSLPEYVSRMSPEQKFIYYAVGETRAQAATSPALEKLKSKGYEVLFVSEPIDEMTLQGIERFEDKVIVDVGKECDDLSDEEKRDKEASNADFEQVRLWMKKVLGEQVTKVEVSTRLVDSPATLVQSEYGVSPNMQKYLRSQVVADKDANDDQAQFSNVFNQAVLEINPDHPVIMKLKELQQVDEENTEGKELIELVFNTAALAAGYSLDNTAKYAKMVINIMTKISNS